MGMAASTRASVQDELPGKCEPHRRDVLEGDYGAWFRE
jgi:hypothetical protein